MMFALLQVKRHSYNEVIHFSFRAFTIRATALVKSVMVVNIKVQRKSVQKCT